MRLTDDRYSSERSQFELALRMIRHEARTRTIRECTGLSDDRIRKLYKTYFRDSGNTKVKRRRATWPRQSARASRDPGRRRQTTALVALGWAGLRGRIDQGGNVHPCWPRPDVEVGHRLCRAYETYLLLHQKPDLSFEWAWNLLRCISCSDELFLASCNHCDVLYVQDAYALDGRKCPACEIEQRDGAHPLQ